VTPSARSLLRMAQHRPWPVPRRPWVTRQAWHDVLFAHWPVHPRALHKRIPPELQLDTRDNLAWIGVVAFEISGARLRAVPLVPGVSRFLQVNVRTYVRSGGRPGVYFFSLDASSLAAVRAARWALRLPYVHAAMSFERQDGRLHLRSRRESAAVHAQIDVDYGPAGPAAETEPGTLDHFLVERYCLFARDQRRQLHNLEIHHPPWRLQVATAELHHNTLVESLDLTTPMRTPLLHYAARQDMLAWWPRAL
jgi:uncharacterized protein YqjF (DUF2071 family)